MGFLSFLGFGKKATSVEPVKKGKNKNGKHIIRDLKYFVDINRDFLFAPKRGFYGNYSSQKEKDERDWLKERSKEIEHDVLLQIEAGLKKEKDPNFVALVKTEIVDKLKGIPADYLILIKWVATKAGEDVIRKRKRYQSYILKNFDEAQNKAKEIIENYESN